MPKQKEEIEIRNFQVYEKILNGESTVRIRQWLMDEYEITARMAGAVIKDVYKENFNQFLDDLKTEKKEQRLSQLSDVYQYQILNKDYSGAAKTVEMMSKIEGTYQGVAEESSRTLKIVFPGLDATEEEIEEVDEA